MLTDLHNGQPAGRQTYFTRLAISLSGLEEMYATVQTTGQGLVNLTSISTNMK
ncbi:hypothetical protein [Hahella sp. KA22]|uniref:hypothetical protein n=1 Tax=Hahella sp. KA22 TaxID=1628392 RepID=UPI0013E3364C|nr:hypothetical protein [Hahella sp. KA22]